MTSVKSGLSRVAAFVTAFALFLTVFLVYPQSAAVLAEDGGYHQSGDGYSINVKAADILINGKAITEGMQVKDGDNLSFNFVWSMDQRPDATQIIFDLSSLLKGVQLTNKVLNDPQGRGSYTISGTQLIMQLDTSKFQDENLSGGVSFDGVIKIDSSKVDESGKFQLNIFDVITNVVVPDYIPKATVDKSHSGQIYMGSNGEYYADYSITVKNQSTQRAIENVKVTDVPSSAVTDIACSDSFAKTADGYVFDIGDIAPGGSKVITYTAKLDKTALANGSGTLQNTAKVTSDNADEVSDVDWFGYSKPSTDKVGTADKDAKKVKWTITVDPGFLKDKVADGSLTYSLKDILGADSGAFTDGTTAYDDVLSKDSKWWNGSKFVIELESSIPDDKLDSGKNESVSNSVTVTPSDPTLPPMSDDEEVELEVVYSAGVDKSCLGKTEATENEYGYITWEVVVSIPDTDHKIERITVKDKHDKDYFMEAESASADSLVLTDQAGKTYNRKAIEALGSVTTYYGIDVNITDQDFINAHKGKSFTIRYATKVTTETNFTITNRASVQVQIDDVTCKDSEDSASYVNVVKAPMLQKKAADYNKYGAYYPLGWDIGVVSPLKNLKPDDIITVTDTLPKGFTFSPWNDTLEVSTYTGNNSWNNDTFNSCVSVSCDDNIVTFVITATQELANYLNGDADAVFHLRYGSVMTDEGYEDFKQEALKSGVTGDYTKNVTNSASGKIKDGDEYGPESATQTITYSVGNTISKSADVKDEKGERFAYYTVKINPNREELFEGNTTVKVRDEFGTNLTLVGQPTITPSAPITVHEAENYFEMELQDKTYYEITYKMKVKMINKDVDYSDEKIAEKFGNTIKVMLDNGGSFGKSTILSSEDYRSSLWYDDNTSEKSVTISGTKNWQNDFDPADLARPKKIAVKIDKVRVVGQLDENGVFVGEEDPTHEDSKPIYVSQEVQPDADGNWSFTIDDLKTVESSTAVINGQTYQVKKRYNYYVSEITVDGYKSSYSMNGTDVASPEIKYDVNGDNVTLNIVNTFDADESEVGSVSITKQWENETASAVRPEIKLVLTDENGNKYENFTKSEDVYTFSNLPLYKYSRDSSDKLVREPMTYTLSETDVNGNALANYELSVVGSTNCKFVLTTSLTPSAVNAAVTAKNSYVDNTTSVTAKKIWVGTPSDKQTAVTVYLMRTTDGAAYEYVAASGADTGVTVSEADKDKAKIILNKTSWTAEITGLPKADAAKNAYTYVIREDLAASGLKEYIPNARPGFKLTQSDEMTVTNTWHDITISVPVTKVWADGAAHLDDTVTVKLYRHIEGGADEFVKNVTLNADKDGTFTVSEELSKFDEDGNEYIYTVKDESGVTLYDEDNGVPGYEPTYSGTTVKNTWKNVMTSITITKVWQNDDAANRTDVTVDVMRSVQGGTPAYYAQYTLRADENYTAKIDGFEKYDPNGKLYVYTVANETGTFPVYDAANNVSGYVTTYNGTTVTNTWNDAAAPTTSVQVEKIWNDDDRTGVFTHANDTVTVELMRKSADVAGEFVQNVTLDSTTGFKQTVSGLDEKDANGNPFTYYVERESGVLPVYDLSTNTSGYEASYSGTTVTNVWREIGVTPATTSVTVRKVWDDTDRTGIFSHENDYVTVTLMRSTGAVTEPVQNIVLTAVNGFTAVVDGLAAADANGNAYVYYIANENCAGIKMYDGVYGYIASYNGTTVTNTWKEEPQQPDTASTAITVVKRWADNTVGVSHGAVNIVLRKYGTTAIIDTASLNELNGWTYTFSELPVYDGDGSRIIYEVVEATALSGYTVSYPDGNTVYAAEGLAGRVTILNTQDSSGEPKPIPPTPWFPPFNPYIPEDSDDISSGAGIIEESERDNGSLALAAVGAVSAIAAVSATVIAALKKKKRKSR